MATVKRNVFMIGPIGTAGSEEHRIYQHALTYIVRKALPLPEWEVKRADEEDAPDSITARVIRAIIESDLIVADLTDHNPNVFYELAVAHGHHKPVVHIISQGQSVPFDVSDQRAVFYDLRDPESVDNAITRVNGAARHAIESSEPPENPQSGYDRFRTISGGTERPTETGKELAESLELLVARIASLDRKVSSIRDEAYMASRNKRFEERDRFRASEATLRIPASESLNVAVDFPNSRPDSSIADMMRESDQREKIAKAQAGLFRKTEE